VVTYTRKVLDTSATNKNDGVLLKVVTYARDVGSDFVAVSKANTSDLTKS
jgi:hypothetical protein